MGRSMLCSRPLGAQGNVDPLPPIRLDEPTLQMTFGTNSSPLAGQDGKQLTARKSEERLFRETQKDVALRVERIPNKESWVVSGRGELHLSILIENMRREGFELEVSKPQVIIKEIDGERCEPYEDLLIDVPNEFVGDIMMSLGNRSAELINMDARETVTILQGDRDRVFLFCGLFPSAASCALGRLAPFLPPPNSLSPLCSKSYADGGRYRVPRQG